MDIAKQQRASELAEEIGRLWKRYPPDADIPASVLQEISGKQKQLDALLAGADGDDLRRRFRDADSYLNDPLSRPGQPGDGGGRRYSGKSVGEAFIESRAFKLYDAGAKRGPSADIELKMLLDTTGWVPESPRLARIEPGVGRPLNVLDLFATGTTRSNAVPYVRETSTTNAAAETAEGTGEKPESALAFTEVSEPVRTIATVLPITQQLIEDVQACRDYVNQRLAYFVRARLDSQLIVGNGTPPNLSGVMDRGGLQTQAKGADPVPDAIGKAMDLVRVNGGYEPDGIVMHPNDWQAVRHLRTADGQYIWGNPADAAPPRIWGLPVAVSTAITENTALVGAFRTAAMLFYRTDMQIAISDSHSDFFIYNKLMLRAEIRVALAVFREEAFCQVTGV